MYYFFVTVNCLVMVFLAYILLFDPDQLATGVGQRAILLTIVSLVSFIILTATSFYFRSVKQMPGLSTFFMVFSWILIIISFFTFISRQKWM
ncbi:MAG: hypothetical protein ABI416_03450 [Ginsengibacter sp.]